MDFYLLKSTAARRKVGDVIIDKNQVEAISLSEHDSPDGLDEDKVFLIKVNMRSNDYWSAVFKTIEEAKQVMKEILGDKVSSKDIDDMVSGYSKKLRASSRSEDGREVISELLKKAFS